MIIRVAKRRYIRVAKIIIDVSKVIIGVGKVRILGCLR